jgi:hypothetical protein
MKKEFEYAALRLGGFILILIILWVSYGIVIPEYIKWALSR